MGKKTQKTGQEDGGRWVVTADSHNALHGGLALRLEETLEAFEWPYKLAVEHGSKRVVHLGDVFHDRSTIYVPVFDRTYSIAKRYFQEHGVRTLWVLGNHDMYYRHRSDITSIRALAQFGELIDEPRTLEVDGHLVDILPYSEHPVDAMRVAFGPDHRRAPLLLFHAAVDGALVNSRLGLRRSANSHQPAPDAQPAQAAAEQTAVLGEQLEEELGDGLEQKAFEGWRLALGGHYHCPQEVVGRLHYVGSTMQHTFGEAGDRKRCMLLDPETLEWTDMINDFSPRFEVIDLRRLTDEGGEMPKAEDFKGCRVRIDMDEAHHHQHLRDYRQAMLDVGALGVSIKRPTGSSATDGGVAHRVQIANATQLAQDPMRLVSLYVKSQAPGDLDPKRLVQMGEKIVERASC